MAQSEYSQQTFKPLLNKLSRDLKLALNHLFTPDAVHPAQIGAFLAALHINRVERRPESLAAAASVLRERALKAEVLDRDEDFVVDIVGTGGDGYNLFNVSTAAAIVAAGAGARVIKSRFHLLLRISRPLRIPRLFIHRTHPGTTTPIPKIPFTFILAPHYHPSLAALAPYRKALPFRTMFNVLGPLINPARPNGMVLGVAEREIGATFANSLSEGGVQRALVVCGCEKLDEISCAGPTWAWELKNGKVTEMTMTPEMFGLPAHPLTAVAGGSPKENAETFKTLLNSGEHLPEKLVPVLDFVCMNASALLVVSAVAKDYVEGVQLAKESVLSGKAWQALEIFRNAGKRGVLTS
ncbi:glycosyl transferase [Cyathus striatus]|nr:glycosyl transferase [Cyathus striatus]